MEKLNELIDICKCGVHLTINGHRDFYETVEDHFAEDSESEFLEEISADVYERMKEKNTIVELQFYPVSPVGFIRVYHYSVECAVDIAIGMLNHEIP